MANVVTFCGSHTACSNVSDRVTNAFPQGSILGLLLFVVYINDLPKITDNDAKVVLFADDTSVIVTNLIKGDFKQH